MLIRADAGDLLGTALQTFDLKQQQLLDPESRQLQKGYRIST